MSNLVTQNPLRSRADFERAALQLLQPLVLNLTAGNAGLHLGETGAVYPASIAEMEGFSRALWAIVPMLATNCEGIAPIWTLWREGIINGTDPDHHAYWGVVSDTDQRMVEMAAPAMGLIFAREKFWDELSPVQQHNLYAWLNQINDHDMPTNNWRFFRVLVNSAFNLLGQPFSQTRLDEDFNFIEEHYESDGWYYDYESQREYYTPWGYHYYGLLYSAAMQKLDPHRCELFAGRAKLFAPRFVQWFDVNGNALPYGRSLAYRFAEIAFFSAMALAGVEAPGANYGQMRWLIAHNMRNWFARPIFSENGILTIGYVYPNLNMAEGYNAPGSPYWALKAFCILALPDSHPFWQAAEQPINLADGLFPESHARMLFSRSSSGGHVVAYQSGNHATRHSHDEAKYEKFAYSTRFGFSVPKCAPRLLSGAYDSMLALSLDGEYWRPRYGCDSFDIAADHTLCEWTPFPGVTVHTEVWPFGNWHVRRHIIKTIHKLMAAEGGFAIERERRQSVPELETLQDRCYVSAPWGASGIVGIRGYSSAEIVTPEPNTNLLHPRTLLPTLHAKLDAGEHVLVCAVLGSPDAESCDFPDIPKEVLKLAEMG